MTYQVIDYTFKPTDYNHTRSYRVKVAKIPSTFMSWLGAKTTIHMYITTGDPSYRSCEWYDEASHEEAPDNLKEFLSRFYKVHQAKKRQGV